MNRRRITVGGRGNWGRPETRLQPARGPLARAVHRHTPLAAGTRPPAGEDPASRGQPTGARAESRPADASGAAAEESAARLARLEAVLLLAREPLPSRKLAQLAELADGTEARTLVRRLNAAYDGRRSAFRVEQSAGGYQLLTRAQFAPWLRRLHSRRMEVRLSSPALETLAVVAYRQPVVRAEIEAVRGVQCGEMLRQLMERDLVRIAGKSQELGRPFVYATTRRFLQVFGLRDLDDLPRADLLRKRASDGPSGSETAGPDDATTAVAATSAVGSAAAAGNTAGYFGNSGNAGNDETSLLPKETPVTLALARPETADDEDELRAALAPSSPIHAADDDDDDFEEEDEGDEDDDLEEDDEEWEEVEDDEEDLDEEDEEWDDEDEEWDDEEDDEEWDDEEEEDEEWDDEE